MQIPELEVPQVGDLLTPGEIAVPPVSGPDSSAGSGTSSTEGDDPLGRGETLAKNNSLAGGRLTPLGEPPPDVLAAPDVRQAAAKKDPPAALNRTLVLAFAGGGAFLGLLCTGLLVWFLFAGSGEEPPAVADSVPVPAVDDVQAPPADTARRQGESPERDSQDPELENENPEASAEVIETRPSSPDPVRPSRDPQPLDLTSIDLDEGLFGYKLPGVTWAAAYDEETARLAITNDEQGLMVYDLDDLWNGDPAPTATFPTAGLPTAVCLKPLQDRRVFVLAGQDQPKVQLIDVETLRPLGEIVLEDLKFIDYLTGSPNPDDPFVYYSTHRSKLVGASESERIDNETADRLGRINLVTKEQDRHTKAQFTDVTVSPDGRRLYARPRSTANGVTGNWNELLTYNGDSTRSKITSWSRTRAASPVCSLGGVVSVNGTVYSQSMAIFAAALDYSPGAVFEHRPLLVGLSNRGIVFGSANDYRRLASIPLPASWLRSDNKVAAPDSRLRPGISPSVRSRFLDIKADSKRGLALIVFDNQLVIAPLDRAGLPSEPSLLMHRSLPERIAPGKTVEVELQLKTVSAGVEFEFVPNTDWLPNEAQRLLGVLPPGEVSPRPLQLMRGVVPEQSFVLLKSLRPLAGRNPPLKLRIGSEVMLVTDIGKNSRLIVERSKPIGHGFSERIAVIDEQGRDVTTPTAPVNSPGTHLNLAASVNITQSIIYLTDVDPLSGESLPLDMQIGDEKMVLTGVDDFRTALHVERSEPTPHPVTSDVIVFGGDSSGRAGPNLPAVSGRTFRWTPTVDQLGLHTIRMRARAGRVTHEWFWDVRVERGAGELPFQIVGIEPDPGTDLAVIWGQAALPYLNPTPDSKPPPSPYFLGIYDLADKRLLRHVEVARPVMAAALHETGVYASLTSLDMEPKGLSQNHTEASDVRRDLRQERGFRRGSKSDLEAERARERAASQITPTQIVRFDLETLDIAARVTIPRHCTRLQVIAGRYLAASERWKGGTLRLNIPDLSPVEPKVRNYQFPIAGRVKDGWVWDGVVWDHQMKKPRLLLFPVHFETPPGAHTEPQIAGGTIHTRTPGRYVCTWCPVDQALNGQYSLTDFPTGLSLTDGSLQAHSWAAPSQLRVGTAPRPTSVELLDLSSVTIAGDRRTRQLRTSGYLSEADGQAHVALLGKLYSVAVDRLVQHEEAFRFVEQQDQFVLETGKPVKLKYSAPGAARYVLQLWDRRPRLFDDQPVLQAESSDGTFVVSFAELEGFADSALRSIKDREQGLEGYLSRIAPIVQSLTGRKPRGVPLPVYVSVVAAHEDGQQRAGLAHSYLIEVPLEKAR